MQASSVSSSVVPVEPARILDTRFDVGLVGPFVSPVSRKLRVTGDVETTSGVRTVVPTGATGVLLNVTVVRPAAAGFVSVRPGDETGAPATSSLNFVAGQTVPNSVQVALPTSGANAGRVDITYDASGAAGPSTEMLVDVVGYLVPGSAGEPGPQGEKGDPGVPGSTGPAGPGYDLAQVVWVATSGGDHTSLSAALASIVDASVSKRYVVKIAPGTYTETSPVALKDFVDVEGSGQGVTTITCACGNGDPSLGGLLRAGDITAEVRHLSVSNTGGAPSSVAVATFDSTTRFSLLHVDASASGGTFENVGVYNETSSPMLTHVSAIATGGGFADGVRNVVALPTMVNVEVTATGGSQSRGMHNPGGSLPTIRGSVITGETYSVSLGALIADSMLVGPVFASGQTCVGAYDQSFAPLDATCRP